MRLTILFPFNGIRQGYRVCSLPRTSLISSKDEETTRPQERSILAFDAQPCLKIHSQPELYLPLPCVVRR